MMSKTSVFILFSLYLFSSIAIASEEAQEVLVYDVNQTPNGNYSSDPKYLIEFDGAVFFAANPNDNWHESAAETRYSGLLVGEELFSLSSDEEVSLFADLNTGFSSSYPRDLVVFNDSLYFIADTESSRVGLYRLNNRFAQPEYLLDMGPVVHINVSPEYGQKLMVVDEQLFLLEVDEDNGWQLNLFDDSNLSANDFLDLFSDDSEEDLSTFWEWFSIENRIFYRNSSHSVGMLNVSSATHQSFADVLAQNEANVDLDISDIEEFQASSDGTLYFLYGGSEKQVYSYDATANLAMPLSGEAACQNITRYLVTDEQLILFSQNRILGFNADESVCELLTDGVDSPRVRPIQYGNQLFYLSYNSDFAFNPFVSRINIFDIDTYEYRQTEGVEGPFDFNFESVVFNGKFYLSRPTAVGSELEAFVPEDNTLRLVSDINEVSLSSNPKFKTIAHNSLYFITTDHADDFTGPLMRLNGGEIQEVPVAEFDDSIDEVSHLVEFADDLYFRWGEGIARLNANNTQLQTYTQFYVNNAPLDITGFGHSIVQMINAGGHLFIITSSYEYGRGVELWQLDLSLQRINHLYQLCSDTFDQCGDTRQYAVAHGSELFTYAMDQYRYTELLVWDLEQFNLRARYSLANMAYQEVYSMTPSDGGMHFILESLNNNSRQPLWYLDFDSAELTNPTANCCSDAEISHQRLLPLDAQFFNNRLYHAFTRERMYVYTPASGAYGAMNKPGSEGAIPIGNHMTLGEGRFYYIGEETLWRLPEEGGDSLKIAQFMLEGDLSGRRDSFRSWRSDPDMLYHDNRLYITAEMPGVGTELVQVNLNTPPEIVISGPNSVNAGFRGFFDASATGMGSSLPLSYQWLQTAGPSVDLANANTPFMSFQAPIDTTDGEILTFQLTVSNGSLTAEQSISIEVLNDGINVFSGFVPFDYDGDRSADIVFRRPSDFGQTIYDLNSVVKDQKIFGRNVQDIPVSGDFDGDGIADIAVRRPATGYWYVSNSSGSNINSDRNDGIQRVYFGRQAQDIPVPADYDGDGITDFAVYRPDTHIWYIKNSSGSNFNSSRNDGIQRISFGGEAEDIPLAADFDGDGKADVAFRRPSERNWYIKNSSGTSFNTDDGSDVQRVQLGLREDDIPVVADFDGDGIADMGFRRPVTQNWYVRLSSSGEIIESTFGKQEQDIPVVADYDGDGRADFAVRRPSENKVFIRRSSDNGIERVDAGIATDIPVAAPMSQILEKLSN